MNEKIYITLTKAARRLGVGRDTLVEQIRLRQIKTRIVVTRWSVLWIPDRPSPPVAIRAFKGRMKSATQAAVQKVEIEVVGMRRGRLAVEIKFPGRRAKVGHVFPYTGYVRLGLDEAAEIAAAGVGTISAGYEPTPRPRQCLGDGLLLGIVNRPIARSVVSNPRKVKLSMIRVAAADIHEMKSRNVAPQAANNLAPHKKRPDMSEMFADRRERVLGAALAVLANDAEGWPAEVRKRDRVVATKVAEMVDLHWPKIGRPSAKALEAAGGDPTRVKKEFQPPLSRKEIELLIGTYLKLVRSRLPVKQVKKHTD